MKVMITHLVKFECEERQKQLKKKEKAKLHKDIWHIFFPSFNKMRRKSSYREEKKVAYMIPAEMQIRHESNTVFEEDTEYSGQNDSELEVSLDGIQIWKCFALGSLGSL